MKQYLKCLIFAAIAAMIFALPIRATTSTDGAKAMAVRATPAKAEAQTLKPPDTPREEPAQSQAAPEPTQTPAPEPVPTDDHQAALAAAGIDPSQWAAADKVIQIESSWNPYAVEPTTGACGLQQELPCGKSGCSVNNVTCCLEWANTYVVDRYGSWDAALSFHYVHGWY